MLLPELPLWSEIFPGFMPEDIERMTMREVITYRRHVRRVVERANQQHPGGEVAP